MSARNFGSRVLSRRNLLRGAGVAITLPWLESLAPRVATAQAAAPRLRFLPIFLPNGSAEVWTPGGQAGAWQLSSILEPFAELKAKMQVLTNLENGSSFNANGSSDNRNALALAALNLSKAVGGQTFSDSYSQLVSGVGATAQALKNNRDAADTLLTQSQSNRDAVSAVNLDEEAANLIKFQQAYQAASQAINIARSLFTTLLGSFQ